MTEPTNTPPAEGEQQPPAATTPPVTPPAATPDPTPAGQEPVDWEARYKGVMTVLNQRQTELEAAKAESGTAAATIEQLTSQTEALRAEYDTKIATLTEQLSAITGERDGALKAQEELGAYKVKMDALKEYPDLLPLADTIPDIPDADVMKQHLELLQKGVTEITTQKAETLTAGMTPGAATPAVQPKYAYTTMDDWRTAMNSAAGEDHFQEISAAYRQWVEAQ